MVTRVTVQKIRWQGPHRHDYLEDAPISASILHADFNKFALTPNFVDPADAEGFGSNPMSNISYRVVLLSAVSEAPPAGSPADSV